MHGLLLFKYCRQEPGYRCARYLLYNTRIKKLSKINEISLK
ncbi:hypothetical protein HMPREF1548_05694 [Clostridium sp. KLE 1755]|nr:hypothetical protein HMPREF1548_05694 [Clostridium sp. KLE 1755]